LGHPPEADCRQDTKAQRIFEKIQTKFFSAYVPSRQRQIKIDPPEAGQKFSIFNFGLSGLEL